MCKNSLPRPAGGTELGPDADNDLYDDPRTTHYTGTRNVLKGWCAAIRWADKLITSDYIHTSHGHPIYFECTDNFDDLRLIATTIALPSSTLVRVS